MTSCPQTSQIFLPSGDTSGIRVAELTTSIVRVIELPQGVFYCKSSNYDAVAQYRRKSREHVEEKS